MVNQLNLSSRPFRNRTLPWILSAVLLAVSVFGAVFVLAEWRKISDQTASVKKETREIEPKITALNAEGEKLKQSLTPEQQKLLLAAHSLVDRKRFSWSRLLGDLENVLPRTVSVSNIAVRDVLVENTGGGRTFAELDFAVLSRDYQSIVNMISQMNESGIFQAELRGQDLQRDKGNLSEYSLYLRYAPRAGVTVSENTAAATAQNQLTEAGR